jgi:hypothetical protein
MADGVERLGSSVAVPPGVRAALVVMLACGWSLACSDTARPGGLPRPGRGVAALEIERSTTVTGKPGTASQGTNSAAQPGVADEPSAVEAVAAPEAAEEKAPRNFATELVQMMGNPASCLHVRAADSAPGQLEVNLSTHVMPSGSVAQSEIQATGLDAAEVQCLESLHFAQPIENAPFAVRGRLKLQQQNPPPPTAADPVPSPKPADPGSEQPKAAAPVVLFGPRDQAPPPLFGPREQIPAVPPPPASEPGIPGEPVPPPPPSDKLE